MWQHKQTHNNKQASRRRVELRVLFFCCVPRAMEPTPRSTPIPITVAFTGTEAYYEKVRAEVAEGSVGCRACWVWMHSNSRDSHVRGRKHTKRIVALGVQTEDVLETIQEEPGRCLQDVSAEPASVD